MCRLWGRSLGVRSPLAKSVHLDNQQRLEVRECTEQVARFYRELDKRWMEYDSALRSELFTLLPTPQHIQAPRDELLIQQMQNQGIWSSGVKVLEAVLRNRNASI